VGPPFSHEERVLAILPLHKILIIDVQSCMIEKG